MSGEVWLAGASFDRASAATDPAFKPPGEGGSGIGAPLVGALVALSLALLAGVTRLCLRRLGS